MGDDHYDDDEQMPDLGGDDSGDVQALETTTTNDGGFEENFDDADALMDEEFMAAFGDQGIEAEQDADLSFNEDTALGQWGSGAAPEGEGGEGEAVEGQEDDLSLAVGDVDQSRGGDDDEGMADEMADDQGAAEAEVEEEEAGLGPGSMSAKDKEEADRKARIIAAMTDDQLTRYEAFRRSSLARPKIKRFVQAVLGMAPNDKTVIALCGIGKLFVGELVEMARHLATLEGYSGPLLPRHITRAYQQLDMAARIPHAASNKPRTRLFGL